VYILYGPKLTDWSTPNFNASAGAAFYNGEVFLIDATSFSVIAGQTAIFQIAITQYTTNADPVTFTDGTLHNIHNIRKIAVLAGTPGSGIADYSQGRFLSFFIPQQVKLAGDGVTGVYPNYTIAGPNGKNQILGAGTVNVGNVSAGSGTDIAVTFTSIGTALYYVMGTIVSNGTDAQADTSAIWSIRSKTDTSFTLHLREVFSETQNIAFEYTIFKNDNI
jgi:hypothetical protein